MSKKDDKFNELINLQPLFMILYQEPKSCFFMTKEGI